MSNMNQNDFDRLSFISKKSLVEIITPDELKEFKQLIDEWSASTEFTLLEGFNQHKNSG